MNDCVLISIKPEWCEKIVSGKKTVEVRKTRPKIRTPFKAYIYCTHNKSVHDLLEIHVDGKIHKANGKVIGEFTCDQIDDARDVGGEDFFSESCMTLDDWTQYTAGYAKPIYLWHISNLVVYDKPKELTEFSRFGAMFCGCVCLNGNCENYVESVCYDEPPECRITDCTLYRPPQSWCYVEELQDG